MAVSTFPDVFGALLQHLKATSDVTALTSTRIGDEVAASWDFPPHKARHAVVVQGPVGGSGELEPPLYRDRYDVWSYGPNRLEALKLARRVRAALLGFSNDIIGEIAEEAGPIRLTDPETGWVYVVQPYLVTFTWGPS